MVVTLLKAIFGDVPVQWLRLVFLGVGITWALFMLRDFRSDVRAESLAVRTALIEYIASNTAWQNANVEQRGRLLRKVNNRIAKLYKIHHLEYDEVEP